MKRIVSLFILIIFVLALICTPTSAEFSNPSIVDKPDIINPKEQTRLSQRLDDLREKYNCDVAVYYTTKGNAANDAICDAEEVIADHNYGTGENCDLIFLYFSMSPGRFSLIARGLGQTALDSEEINKLSAEISTYLNSGKFVEAIDLFADRADERLSTVNGTDKNSAPTEVEKEHYFDNVPVFDSAGYLSDEYHHELDEKIEGIRQKYNFDVAIFTTNHFEESDNESIDQYVKSLYNKKHYGAGNGRDGIMLFVAIKSRQYCIYVNGERGTEVFNHNGHAYIENQILPYLEKSDFEGAFNEFAKQSEKLLDMASKGEPFNELQFTTRNIIIIVCILLLPLLIAFLLMNNQLRKMKTAVAQNYAHNYVKDGSFNLDVEKDIYLYSNVIKTKIRNDNNSSSRGSGPSRSRSGSF